MGSVLDNLNPGVLNSLSTGPLGDLLYSNLNLGTLGGSSSVACFDESTEILCLNHELKEVYVPIDQLKKGSIIKTFKHGYRKIDLIYKGSFVNDVNNFHNCMYILPKDKNMTKDLIITGGHSVLVNSMSKKAYNKNMEYFGETIQEIDGKQLLIAAASDKFKALENKNVYNYYHFVLENDGNDDARYGVWANGVLTETPSKKWFTEIFLKENPSAQHSRPTKRPTSQPSKQPSMQPTRVSRSQQRPQQRPQPSLKLSR